MKKCLRYFTPPEWGLWLGSVLAIGGAYRAFDRGGWVTLAADGAQSDGINLLGFEPFPNRRFNRRLDKSNSCVIARSRNIGYNKGVATKKL